MDELKAEGVDTEEMLANPTYSEGVGVVTQRLLERADWLYKRAIMALRSCLKVSTGHSCGEKALRRYWSESS